MRLPLSLARHAEAIAKAEWEIDRHVYALYGLTPDEIKIVEGSTVPPAL